MILPDYIAIKRSKRARRMTLRLDYKARVVNLVIPKRASLNKAYDFARLHSDWINDKLAELPEAVPFADGTIIPFMGEDLTIMHLPAPRAKRASIKLVGSDIVVKAKDEDFSAPLERFLKKQAKIALADLASEKAGEIGKEISDISIRDTKSRWGSCSSDGQICFSWRLALAKYEAMDYVVAHEVAHLVHLNHSKAFWALCQKLSVDYVEGKYWMHEYGQDLMRFGAEV